MNRPAEAKIHDRSIKKHQKRLTSGAATRCSKIRKNIQNLTVGFTKKRKKVNKQTICEKNVGLTEKRK